MKTLVTINDNSTITDAIERQEAKGWQYVKSEDIHDETDIPWGEGMFLSQKVKLFFEQEQELQALDQAVEPSAEYCYVDEPGHTAGWYCPHPEHAYPQENSACPCGVEGCKGLDWLLDGNEPY